MEETFVNIITVPADQAREIAERLYLSGVKGFLNFTTVPLNVSPENLNVAALGQAKHLFSWDLTALTSMDSNGDGLPDFWEEYWFGAGFEVSPFGDEDGDFPGKRRFAAAH